MENVLNQISLPTDTGFVVHHYNDLIYIQADGNFSKVFLKEDKQLLPKQNNILPLTFLITSSNFKRLIKESGGLTTVGANFLTTGSYGIPIHLKGFVEAEGISIDINEKITV